MIDKRDTESSNGPASKIWFGGYWKEREIQGQGTLYAEHGDMTHRIWENGNLVNKNQINLAFNDSSMVVK